MLKRKDLTFFNAANEHHFARKMMPNYAPIRAKTLHFAQNELKLFAPRAPKRAGAGGLHEAQPQPKASTTEGTEKGPQGPEIVARASRPLSRGHPARAREWDTPATAGETPAPHHARSLFERLPRLGPVQPGNTGGFWPGTDNAKKDVKNSGNELNKSFRISQT